MASLNHVLCLGVCISAWLISTADMNTVPTAENIRWVSLDFKTILMWTVKEPDHKFTVLYSVDDGDWQESHDCIQVSELECDLTHDLQPFDRLYSADIQTDTTDEDYTADEPPHAVSPHFNPYKESNISAVKFTVRSVDKTRVIVNITDPLTSIHVGQRQLSIRDIFAHDLQYKVIYRKSESTGKKEITSNSSVAEVPNLDEGQRYCFMVAAFIPSRPQNTKWGAWSEESCTHGDPGIGTDLSLGAWVGAIFVFLTVLIIIITVTVLCCRRRRERNTGFQTYQSSTPI
ncbi:tissue factor-like isoform X1 [Acanthopagrus latus]|uniref:tissue factor-like isoform X1 n=1 Tax=Acanthopagrus latus TaxID=8177 RepID=UPI00187CEF61|nr:tissue factor-like isoform X1 [Acanthopagrus latus]